MAHEPDQAVNFPSLQGAGVPMIRDLFKDESGASAVEYSLLLSLIAIAIMTAVSAFSQSVLTLYTNLSTTITSATGS
jgi:pilus assembly protein Flp/PilA